MEATGGVLPLETDVGATLALFLSCQLADNTIISKSAAGRRGMGMGEIDGASVSWSACV